MEEKKELEIILRSLLVSSNIVLSANKVFHEFEAAEGKRFPFKKFGFCSFVEYLKSIPSVVKLVPPNSNNPEVHPVGSEKSKHIDLLVTKQRNDTTKKSGFNRRPARRRLASVNPLPVEQTRQVTDRQTYHTVDRQDQRPINRQKSHPVDRHTHHSIKGSTHNPFDSQSQNSNSRKTYPINCQTQYPVDGKSHYPIERRIQQLPVRPTDHEVSTNVDIEFVENVLWELVKKVYKSKTGIQICDLENELKYKYNKDQLERNGIYCARDLLNQASDMVEWNDDKLFPKFPSSSGSTDHASTNNNVTSAVNTASYDQTNLQDGLSNEKFSEQINERSKGRLHVSQTSYDDFQRMISNFRTILKKYPMGILANELPEKYCEEFGVDLDISDLGFYSVISMVTNLPSVFTYKRIGESDWKLYDACVVKQSDIVQSEDEAAFSENLDDKMRYIPRRLFDDIKSLVKQNPEGLRSTAFISMYENHFNRIFNFEKFGFNNMEDFLKVLEKIIYVQKTANYCLLLPKCSETSVDIISKSISSSNEI